MCRVRRPTILALGAERLSLPYFFSNAGSEERDGERAKQENAAKNHGYYVSSVLTKRKRGDVGIHKMIGSYGEAFAGLG